MSITADKLIDLARDEVGYLEKRSNSQLDSKTANAGNKNYTKYARDLAEIPGLLNGNKQGYAWCAVFVVWLFVKAFGVETAKKLLYLPENSLAASCTYAARYFENNGQLFKSNPQPGDQIFFNDSDGDRSHTGIVTSADDRYVYTIEGNTSSESGVVANGGGVHQKQYLLNNPNIYGYGRPLYNEEAEEQPEKEESPEGFTDAAEHMDTAKIGAYKVKQCSGLHLRTGAGTEYESLALLPSGTPVVCLGYYTGDWLRVETADSRVGFCHSDYLIKQGG